MDHWDQVSAQWETATKLHELLDRQEFVFYFKHGKSVYGATEESRIMFARLKTPNDNEKEDEGQFLAVNLDTILKGEGTQRVFGKKDVDQMKVIDRDEAADLLSKTEKKGK
jgi:hypothetical protein